MRFLRSIALLPLLLGVGTPARASAVPEAMLAGPKMPLPEVWETSLQNFDLAIYDREVERLISAFEDFTKTRLAPGPKKKVGLKIYTDSGPGLSTPPALTRAVINALEKRGFEPENIFLVGLNAFRLRMTNYLPSLAAGDTMFKGHPVYVLESGRYYDPAWFYDSPLPQRIDEIFVETQTKDVPNNSTKEEDRKSFLATPLFLDADFWINLPVYSDHPTLGVNGALVNATLWNASNTSRFFRSPANAPAAVAEMAGIPELKETWAFTIVSLERYQFIGGPFFNSLYTVTEPVMYLSKDPVMLDSLMLERMNKWRKKTGFQPISEDIHTLDFAERLKVGSTHTESAKIIKLAE